MQIFALLALVAAVFAAPNADMRPIITKELVEEINNSGASWTASLDSKFASWTAADAKRLCGTKIDKSAMEGVPVVDTVIEAIPASFDSRTQWPGCVHPVLNQEQCGSCWAFAATEALSDRFAIQTNLSTNVVLSPQDLVSCDTANGNQGCNGGYPIYAWQYMQQTGIVTWDCYPYTSGGGVTGNCLITAKKQTCPASGQTFQLYYAASAYAVAPNVAAIQTEIYTNGPIEVAFDVYEDFFSYTSGVYVHKSGALAGGHAVKMLGWGTLNNVAYWICENSWGTTWGMEGFFLIKRGVDECGIEDNGVAGLAATSSL
jgi:cathepsin B